MEHPKIGIALGGGGARGYAHIGVLQVLHEAGFSMDYVAGTSMGAVVGAIYAETLDPSEVQHRFVEFLQSETFEKTGIPRLHGSANHESGFWNQVTSEIRGRLAINLARSRKSLIKSERLINAIRAVLTIRDFEETKIPLTVVATDIANGHDVPFTSGDLIFAVEASSSVPGFLAPIRHNGQLLSDGGISCPVPVSYIRENPDFISIGVAVPPPIHYQVPLDNAIQILTRAEQITSYYYSNMQMTQADVQIYPKTESIQWNDFDRLPEMIEAGRSAAEAALPVLREVIRQRKPWWRRFIQDIQGEKFGAERNKLK